MRRMFFMGGRWAVISLLAWGAALTLGAILYPQLTASTLMPVLGLLACVGLGTFAAMKARTRDLRRAHLRGERQRDRAEAVAETASDTVHLLELKIASLEKALEQALAQAASH